MPSEMDFLRAKWPKLAALGSEAERLIQVSPVGAIDCLQSFCAWAMDISLDMLGIQIASNASDEERLNALYASGLMPADIIDKFQIILSAGSNSTYRVRITSNEAYTCFNHAADIGQWMKRESEVMRAGRVDNYRPAPAEVSNDTGRRGHVLTPPSPATGIDAEPPRSQNSRQDSADSGTSRRGGSSGSGYRTAPPTPAGPSGFMAIFDEYRQYFYIGLGILATIVVGVVIALLVRNGQNKAPITTVPPPTQPAITDDGLGGDDADPTPDPTPTAPPVETTSNLSSLSVDGTKPKTMTENRWNFNNPNADFNMNGARYVNGIGMFVSSSTISDRTGELIINYKLESKYTELRFDLGCDDQLKGYKDSYGRFRIKIFADDSADPLYDSDFQKYDFFQKVTVDVTNVTKLKIVLTEEKGADGTLNVIMGDAVLVNAPGQPSGTQPAGTVSPTPTGTPNASPSPTPTATAAN